jgi:hypothetical protein
MLVRSWLLISLITLLTSCKTIHHTTSAPIPNKEPITAFTRVQVKGNIDINLYTGNAHPGVSLEGNPQDIAQIKMRVRNGVLQISLTDDYPKYGRRVHADIRTHYLTSFVYKGRGTIIGENIHTGYLDLTLANKGKTLLQGSITLNHLIVRGPGFTKISGIKGDNLAIKMSGSPRVELHGTMDTKLLTVKGHGWLSLYWLKTDNITIRARENAFIQIAGTAKVLDVELWDKARFNGHYLRGARVFAKTHGQAIADISASKRQHTLATDSSNIYFHELPDMKTDFMGDNGSVLDLRDWELAATEEVNRYNR